ncbi:MAG: hypothetical protein CMJ78_01465 [Planctomycetaceae bacterium]|nr:hypothetical protein [Planctomycetaceae bacterium]
MLIRTLFSTLRRLSTSGKRTRRPRQPSTVAVVGCEHLEDRKLLTTVDLNIPVVQESDARAQSQQNQAAAPAEIDAAFAAEANMQQIGLLLPAVQKVRSAAAESPNVDDFAADVETQEIGLLLPAVQKAR